MGKPRKRYNELGRPAECRVVIPPDLSMDLYEERLDGGFRDETELVCAIVREWRKGRSKVDWPALLKRLQAEEAENNGGSGSATGAAG